MAAFGNDLFSVFESDESTKRESTRAGVKRKSTVIESKEAKKKVENVSVVETPAAEDDTENRTVISQERSDDKIMNAETPDVVHSQAEMKPIFSNPSKVMKLDCEEGCTHEVAVPPEMDYQPLKPYKGKPAKEYKFTLDPFQNEAIKCLNNDQSVLVSAHTSAGKTVVAEYAIAMSLRDTQRVIYTTPIKALSNQKYRELLDEFKDVGLMTGDVTINPSASCLVMTTEILRNMLYRGSEVMREVGWLVFDEIHYMRDPERGVVWEETIILLPDKVRYVFLSATIPNASQFAQWICELHHQPCHVVYTDYRPVPLQHYVFPAGADGIYLVKDEKGQFRDDNFQKAMMLLQEGGEQGDRKGRRGGIKGVSNCFKLVKMTMERSMQPVIAFCFSRNYCEAFALEMSKLDFNNMEEKSLVNEVFTNAIDCLSDEDKKLPQVEHVLPLLQRGIGIHHSGLLPILKETIEILFSEGLIKALFATETFSLGLNMPAKTVLFTGARKFDGKDFRWITSGEYIQMSGRAGRRGLDDKGIVIAMIDEKMDTSIAKGVLLGLPDPLNSAFHLTYNMVLNLLRVEEINPEFVLERSFYQFQNNSSIPSLERKLRSLEEQRDAIVIEKEDLAMSYYKLRQQLDKLGSEMQKFIVKPKYILPFLQPGRLVKVESTDDDFGWGCVVNFQKKANQVGAKETVYIAEVLLNCSISSIGRSKEPPKPPSSGEKGELQVVPVLLPFIKKISSIRIYIPMDLRPPDNRFSVSQSIQEVQRRFPDGLPLLDPVQDMNIKDDQFKNVIKKIEALEQRLRAHSLDGKSEVEKLYDLCERKSELSEEIAVAKKSLKRAQTIMQMDELKCRKRVLRRLGYASSSDVIDVKGRVACEISSGDELLLTELLFNGVFNDLTAEQSAALLCCFVFQEKSEAMPKLKENLSGPLKQMQDSARRIARVSNESKLPVEEDVYVASFKPHLMDVVHAWASGAPFSQLCKMTDAFEGSIIRCIRRLEELMRQMCQASKAIGNTDLEKKFEEGISKIKRDIIFAASLYL